MPREPFTLFVLLFASLVTDILPRLLKSLFSAILNGNMSDIKDFANSPLVALVIFIPCSPMVLFYIIVSDAVTKIAHLVHRH